MVGFGKHNNIEFVRMVTINTTLEKTDIDYFFKTLEQHVSEKLLKKTAS
jgi:hypothetical protein